MTMQANSQEPKYLLVLVGGTGLLFGIELLRRSAQIGSRPARIVYVDNDQKKGDPQGFVRALTTQAKTLGITPVQVVPMTDCTTSNAKTLQGCLVGSDWATTALTARELNQDVKEGFFADPKLAAAWWNLRGVKEHESALLKARDLVVGTGTIDYEHIVLAGSLTGGTGAGTLVDLARILRERPPLATWQGKKNRICVLAFLPWMNPEKGTAVHTADQAKLNPDWKRCSLNAIGGLTNIQDTLSKAHGRSGPAFWISLFGVPIGTAKTTSPPAVPEGNQGTVNPVNPVFTEAALALRSLLAPASTTTNIADTGLMGHRAATLAESVHRALSIVLKETMASWHLGETESAGDVPRPVFLQNKKLQEKPAGERKLFATRRNAVLDQVANRPSQDHLSITQKVFADEKKIKKGIEDLIAAGSAANEFFVGLADFAPGLAAEDIAARGDAAGWVLEGVLEECVARWLREAKIEMPVAPMLLPANLQLAVQDVPGVAAAGQPVVALPEQAYGLLREEIGKAIDQPIAALADGMFREPSGVWSHPIASLQADHLAFNAALDDAASKLKSLAESSRRAPVWFEERVLPLYLGFVCQKVVAYPLGKEDTGPFSTAASLGAQAILKFEGTPVGLAFGNVLLPHVNVLTDLPEADLESAHRGAFARLVTSMTHAEKQKSLDVLRSWLDKENQETLSQCLRFVHEITKRGGGGASAPNYHPSPVGPVGATSAPAYLPILEATHPEIRFVTTPPEAALKVLRTGKLVVTVKKLGSTLDECICEAPGEVPMSLPEVRGWTIAETGHVSHPHGPTLYVWRGGQSAVTLVGRTITITGIFKEATNAQQLVTLEVHLDRDVPAPVSLSRDDVFVPKLLRFKAGTNPVAQYPDVPVNREFLHLVVNFRKSVKENGSVDYLVDFKGGFTEKRTYSELDMRNAAEDDELAVACWPHPTEGLAAGRRGKWTYWTFYLGDNGLQLPQLGLHFEVLGRKTVGARFERLDRGEDTVRVVDGAAMPEFIFVQLATGGSGAFRIPASEPAGPNVAAAKIGLDFGTSNTSAAVDGEPIDFVADGTRAPFVMVGNDPSSPMGLRTSFPWLPSVRSANDTSKRAERRPVYQIPSGLFSTKAALAPFDGSTFAPPDANIAIYRNSGTWYDDLKWNDDTGPTECFLRSILLWAAAGLSGDHLTFKASYPLAFGVGKKQAYDQLLGATLNWVTQRAGLTLTPSGGHLGTDEASILLLCAREMLTEHALLDAGIGTDVPAPATPVVVQPQPQGEDDPFGSGPGPTSPEGQMLRAIREVMVDGNVPSAHKDRLKALQQRLGLSSPAVRAIVEQARLQGAEDDPFEDDRASERSLRDAVSRWVNSDLLPMQRRLGLSDEVLRKVIEEVLPVRHVPTTTTSARRAASPVAAPKTSRALGLAVCVDIGGGTVDTSVGVIAANRGCQVIAAESTRLGANLLGRSIRHVLGVGKEVLDFAIRGGLADAVWTTDDPIDAIQRLTNSALDAARLASLKKTILEYYLIHLEHTARIAAATLLDTPTLVQRMSNGPGTQAGLTVQARWVMDPSVRVVLPIISLRSGNGWKWLSPALQSAWQTALLGRIRELVESQALARANLMPGCEWDLVDVSNRRLSFVWEKHEVAARSSTNGAVNNATTPAHCVCDGFNNSGAVDWFCHIGDGSLIGHELIPELQSWGQRIEQACAAVWRPQIGNISGQLKPPVPSSVRLRTHSVDWPAGFEAPNDESLTGVRPNQYREAQGSEYRRLSTMRAWLELEVSKHFDPDWHLKCKRA